MFLLIFGFPQARIGGLDDKGNPAIFSPQEYAKFRKPKSEFEKKEVISWAKETYKFEEKANGVISPFGVVGIEDAPLKNLAAKPALFELLIKTFYRPKDFEIGYCEFCGKPFWKKTKGQRICTDEACAKAQHARIIRDYRASKKSKGKKR